ncbi:MAG: hypothetical protein ACO1O6_08625 [Bacteroidota bacterium]
MEPNKDILKHIKAKQKPAVDPAYFEQFRASMMEEIKKQQKPGNSRVVYLRPVFWVSAAAAVVALVFGIRLFIEDPKTNFASVSQEEIETYLEEHEKENVWEVVEDPEETTEPVSVPTAEKQRKEEAGKNIEIASTEGFVSSAQLLDELSTDEIYQYIESEDFDLEELDYSQF